MSFLCDCIYYKPCENIYSSQNTAVTVLELFLATRGKKREILFHEKARLLKLTLNWNRSKVFFFYSLPKKQKKYLDS